MQKKVNHNSYINQVCKKKKDKFPILRSEIFYFKAESFLIISSASPIILSKRSFTVGIS